MIFTLQPNEIRSNWAWIEPFLLKVEDPGWKPLDILQALEAKRAQLWGWLEHGKPAGVIVTCLENIGSTRYGVVWIAAGDGVESAVGVYLKFIEPWFTENGCEWAEICGRKGWSKFLPDYRERARVYVRDL